MVEEGWVMNVMMTFNTMLSAQMIDQLIDSQCMKGRNVRFSGLEMTAQGTRKTVTIEFEDPRDRDRFRNAYNSLNRQADAASQAPSEPKRRTKKTSQRTGFLHSLTASVFRDGRTPQRRPSR
jgi:hypothetical protein